jgi:integrase
MKPQRKNTRDADGSVYWRPETRIVNGRKKTVRQYYARVRWKEAYLDGDGQLKYKNREKKRRATSHTDAVALRRKLRDEVKADLEKAARVPEPGEKTFAELAEWYKEKYLIEPRYVGDRKVSGLESWKSQRDVVDRLVKYFGSMTLGEITHERIEEYRQLRLSDAERRIAETIAKNEACFAAKKKKTKKKKELSARFLAQTNVTAVDRELQRMRAMLNKAIPKWLAVNPFQGGDQLITLSQEEGRDRIMRRGEEPLLLAQCIKERAHLYTAIIFALDTALRQTEQFRVTWSCVDWLNNVITLKSRNTKGKRKRVVPITKRLRPLLVELYEHADKNPKGCLFPFTTFKHSFNTARDRAGISDLLWRDLRATGITWMLDAGLAEAKVMKIVGHTNYRTFLKYVRMSIELAQEAGEKMDARRAELEREGKFAAP